VTRFRTETQRYTVHVNQLLELEALTRVPAATRTVVYPGDRADLIAHLRRETEGFAALQSRLLSQRRESLRQQLEPYRDRIRRDYDPWSGAVESEEWPEPARPLAAALEDAERRLGWHAALVDALNDGTLDVAAVVDAFSLRADAPADDASGLVAVLETNPYTLEPDPSAALQLRRWALGIDDTGDDLDEYDGLDQEPSQR
jgi:hypothetical protein